MSGLLFYVDGTERCARTGERENQYDEGSHGRVIAPPGTGLTRVAGVARSSGGCSLWFGVNAMSDKGRARQILDLRSYKRLVVPDRLGSRADTAKQAITYVSITP